MQFALKRERSARRPPAFPASHCWNQVLTIVQSSCGLLARGSSGNWVKHLSHQPAGLAPLSIYCVQDFSCHMGKNESFFFQEVWVTPSHFVSYFYHHHHGLSSASTVQKPYLGSISIILCY